MSAFYEQISAIQDKIADFNDKVTQISKLHSASLDATANEAVTQRNANRLDSLVAETSAASADLKNRIFELQKQKGGGKGAQVNLVRSKFVEAIQNYQQVESQYRAKYKQRIERQFKIVKPEATDEEVRAVVNDEEGSQVFTQALLNSNRYGASREVYREVQERHEDVRRIERTMAELAQLFNDLSILVEKDDDVIDHVQQNAVGVEADTEAALGHTDKARKSAISARKKRWICFFIILIILAIIGIVLGIEIPKNINKSSSS